MASTRVKVEIWFDVPVEVEDAAYVMNDMLTEQIKKNEWYTVAPYALPPIYDWIVSEPAQIAQDEE